MNNTLGYLYGNTMMLGSGFGYSFLLIIAASVITMIASATVNLTFNKYNKILSMRGITGAEAARKILNAHGLNNVAINSVGGRLTDFFDPSNNSVNLSGATYNSTSIAAIGVVAHECGHAIQYAVGYKPIKIRNSIVPVVNFTNKAALPLLLIGIILGITGLSWIGLILYSLVLVFQILTLPVEFNASNRALEILESSGMLIGEENKGARKVLTAAAMTYVAAVAATSLQILRFALIILGNSNSRRRD